MKEPNKRSAFSKLLPSIFTAFFITIISATSLAYDPDCTHQILSQRAAELHALHYGKSLSPNEVTELKKGSQHEDTGVNLFFRSIHHFYDIHNQRPWTDRVAANLAAATLSTCFLDAHNKKVVHTAKEWALTPQYQQESWPTWDLLPCSYDGDYSWLTILEMLNKQRKGEETAFALGHILHLVQDLTVPAHTRNDSHFPGNTDHLEDFAKKQCQAGLIPSAKQLYAEGVRPIVPSDIGQMFDGLATYTYSHYLSRDTKFSPEYDAPKAIRRGTEIINGKKHTFLYITDFTAVYGLRTEYRLIEINPWWEKNFPTATDQIYFFSDHVSYDYWQRLMRKAVAYGAGLIHKFTLEKEARQLNPKSPGPCSGGEPMPRITWTPKTSPPETIQASSVKLAFSANIHVFGAGNRESSHIVFNTLANRWEERNEPAAPLLSGAAAVVNNVLYAFGEGASGSGFVFRYNPAGDSWNQIVPNPFARPLPGAFVFGNKIYLIGGDNQRQVNSFDVGGNSWVAYRPYPSHFPGNLTGVMYRSKFYVFNTHRQDLKIYQYDPPTDAWNAFKEMPETRSGARALLKGKTVWLVGGVMNDGRVSDSIYLYELENDVWCLASSKLAKPMAYSFIGEINGKIYLMTENSIFEGVVN